MSGPFNETAWWRDAVVYQIYPLSFADSNGDGFGDLEGITERLDYLSDTLGVDAIWLSPFYRSPMEDWGYDVSDHTDVDPIFGDLDAAKSLIKRAHDLGLKVIVDYVINHTSDQHPWFVEAASSRDNPKRDWYVWRDGRDGGPPNNWVSTFGGPGWTLHETTGQWYRHTFLTSQPDLNWRDPEVVEAMMDVVRFWLDLGVDGFRVDAAHHMMKDELERDNPPAPDRQNVWKAMGAYDDYLHIFDSGQSGVHEVHKTFRKVVDSYHRDALTIGEMHIFDLEEWASYYGDDLDEFTMPFNFHLMAADWNAAAVRGTVEAVLESLPDGAWTNWTLGNHDEKRLVSRLPEDNERIAATLILTLPGTPFLYYGDELGMREAEVSDSRDPWGRNVSGLSRDGCRAPMPWTTERNAGFSAPEATAWLPVDESDPSVNVESQLVDGGSLLNMYRRLLRLRKSSPVLRLGSYHTDPASADDVFVYHRTLGDEGMAVALNFGDGGVEVEVGTGRVLFSSHVPERADRVGNSIEVAPYEAVIISND